MESWKVQRCEEGLEVGVGVGEDASGEMEERGEGFVERGEGGASA